MRSSALVRLSFTLFFGATLFLGEALADGMKITEMAVSTKIVKGNPIDSVHRISSTSVQALYCFTRIVSPDEGETNITHIWYLNDEVVGKYVLPVKGGRWRTYSKKVLEKGTSGDWRCDALDSDGKLLKSVSFKMN